MIGLHKYRVVKGETKEIAELKAEMQLEVWNERWAKFQVAEQQRARKAQLAWGKETKKGLANERTDEAQAELRQLETLLLAAACSDNRLDWSSLKDQSPFPGTQPVMPIAEPMPREPLVQDEVFKPVLGLFDRVIPWIRERKQREVEEAFTKAHREWRVQKEQCERRNAEAVSIYDKKLSDWNAKKATWDEKQRQQHARVEEQRVAYLRREPAAIAEYCELVLTRSDYPDSFPEEFVAEYTPETRTVVVDAALPPSKPCPK